MTNSIKEECVNSCGEGARGGNRCHWVEQDLDNTEQNVGGKKEGGNDYRQGYSTCSVDAATCPDGRCDQLEQESDLCPQDCVDRGIRTVGVFECHVKKIILHIADGIETPVPNYSKDYEHGLGRDPSHSASNETFCRCHNRGRSCYCDTRQVPRTQNSGTFR